MNQRPHLLYATLLLLPMLGGCQPADAPQASSPTAAADGEPRTALGRTVDKALREAREKMATENISISGDMDIQIGSQARASRRKPRDSQGNPLPKAEISPAGDLLIGGTPVVIDQAQRALLLDYRGHVVRMVETGMSLGVKGADLGMLAAGEALKGVFTGQADGFEQRIEAEATKIEAEALRLCDQMPAMLATQRQLADTLPEFKPYTTLTAQDIEDCRDEHDPGVQSAQLVRDEIREDIRSGIRQSVRAAVAGNEPAGTEPDMSAAEEAEAATQQ